MSTIAVSGSMDKENISIDPSSAYTGQGEKVTCNTPTTPSAIDPPVLFDGTILHSGISHNLLNIRVFTSNYAVIVFIRILVHMM